MVKLCLLFLDQNFPKPVVLGGKNLKALSQGCVEGSQSQRSGLG